MGCCGKKKKKTDRVAPPTIDREAQEAAEAEARRAHEHAVEAKRKADREWNDRNRIVAPPRRS